MRSAIGLLEVQGYSVALAAMDQACKSADIHIEGMDCNNPSEGDRAPIPVVIQVKFTGGISDVRIALDVAREEASKYIREQDILTHLIPSGSEELMKLLSTGKVKVK
ncbi:BMC domain-containing protein [Cytobacillus spongiae]|jgi:microcompartment protein CcmL/EutN|uniref:BMC domain-containing protein n=1 Tax=Cytobacillus spongiae TaxID=2901381 RepID=UPI001F19DCB7|nr:BMC domain-containing protein [Cytobacillus spongiae]UII55516.1 BMC domain-containing protein [Cytobacillus spongiae]